MSANVATVCKGAARGLRLDRVSYAGLAAPLAGLIFLLPIFAGHAGHSAILDPTTVVATVNGVEITNGDWSRRSRP